MSDWRARAHCRDEDPELFYPTAATGPEFTRQVAAAKAVCRGCPVVSECLEEALSRIPYGIAGGLTEKERRQLSGVRARNRIPELPVNASPAERANTGRRMLAAGVPAPEVVRALRVTRRSVDRWAAENRAAAAKAAAGAEKGA